MTTSGGEGLSSQAIAELRERYGYNELAEKHESLAVLYMKSFWGPLPWLMELMVAITYFSGNGVEAVVIIVLLILNSGIHILQRRSADKALASLRRVIQVSARVRRDGEWSAVPARELLPGDAIRLRAGDVVPADARLLDGSVSVDLSSLTGESVPRDISPGEDAYSGGIVRRGEATAIVISTGISTRYGKTTELLEAAHPPTHMEKVVFAVIKYFFIVNVVVAAGVVVFGIWVSAPAIQIANYVVVLLLMSVPVAFPTMFAVAQTYGALQLDTDRTGRDGDDTGRNVLTRRLAALQEAAVMDVLCSDKTGTLTMNRLAVADIRSYGGADEHDVLALASAASDDADEDPIDQAILKRAADEVVHAPKRTSFTPFDPSTKRTRAEIDSEDGARWIEKGLPDLLLVDGVVGAREALRDAAEMSGKGMRVLAVTTGVVERGNGQTSCVGLIGLRDPIRPDAPALIRELTRLGIRIVMITGDGRITAQAVAESLGLTGDVFTPADLERDPSVALSGSVFAEAYPEDKLTIIESLQRAGHVVGMTGDGVNDAPALHRAEVGIAVLGSTEVAKQSASFILTSPGLEGVRRVVTSGRRVYIRIHTWVLNKVIKSVESLFIATVIFVMTHSYILSPLIAILILLANDFVTLSIATDHTRPLMRPARWDIRSLVAGSFIVAVVPYAFTMGLYLFAWHMGYAFDTIRTVAYFSLICLGATTLLAVRAWPYGWSVRVKWIMAAALAFSLVFSSVIVTFGIFIRPLPAGFYLLTVVCSILSFFAIELVKRIPFVERSIRA